MRYRWDNWRKAAGAGRPAFARGKKGKRDTRYTHELHRELGELSRRAREERNEKAPVRVGPVVAVGIGVAGGGILNLGGSIDFTIWTPPKVKNKPSRTYSTLIKCLSSARLVSTHRPLDKEREKEKEGAKQSRMRWRRSRRGGRTRKREPTWGRKRVEARVGNGRGRG